MDEPRKLHPVDKSESDILRQAYHTGGTIYGPTDEGYRRWLREMNTIIGREMDYLGLGGDPRRNVVPFNPRVSKQ